MLSRRITQLFGKFNIPLWFHMNSKNLFTPATIGMENYVTCRKNSKQKLKGTEDKFREKMKNYCNLESGMLYTDDIKQIIHIADSTEDDMKLVEKMIMKYCEKMELLRFGRPNFVFGPVIMRMYHYLNKPNEALKMFYNESCKSLFNQVGSCVILMDLLFVNGMYSEILNIHKTIRKENFFEGKYPQLITILISAMCYKLNSIDSFAYCQEYWKEVMENDGGVDDKSILYAAALALNQNSPQIALEITSCSDDYDANMEAKMVQILAFTKIGRVDDALLIMQNIFAMDCENDGGKICTDIVDIVKEAVSKLDDEDLIQQCDRIIKQLNSRNCISLINFNSYLSRDIHCINYDISANSDFPKPSTKIVYHSGIKDMM